MTENNLLLKGNIRSNFFRYLIPSVGGMLGTSLYVLGDTMIVGRYLGNDGLVALNLSIPIINVFTGLGLLCGIGGATLLSIDKGRSNHERLNKFFTLSMSIALIFGIILTLLRIFFLDEFVRFLGATDNIFTMSRDYLNVLLLFSIPFVLNIALTVFVRNDNAPRLAMIAMLSSCIFNVVFDYIFIVLFKWGMMGGALATGLAPVVGLSILASHFIKGTNTISISKVKVKVHTLWSILKTGFPSFIIELSSGIVIFAFNAVILKNVGKIGVSAYTVIANLSLIAVAIFTGVAQGIQPIISINYGASKRDRYMETIRLGILTSFILGILFYLSGLIFPKQLVSLFSHERGEFLEITANGIRIYFLAFLVMGVNITLTSFMQSKEQETSALVLSLMRGLGVNLVLLLILSSLLGINGVWLTLFLTEILVLIFAVVFYTTFRKGLLYAITSRFNKTIL